MMRRLEHIYTIQEEINHHPFRLKKPVISVEVFPPKGENAEGKIQALLSELESLKSFNPAMVSVTYGAGGSTRGNSMAIVKKVKNGLKMNVMPHFTCICSDKEYIKQYLKELEAEGIVNILALRGDEPKETDVCYSDFKFANELVKYLDDNTNFSIAVAGYPECHKECPDIHMDIANLKRKIDAGGEIIYTQLFFDNDYYFKFVQLVRDAGIEVPIIPGILPVTAFSQLERMTEMCGATVPLSMRRRFEKFKSNPDDIVKAGVELATIQTQQLIDAQVPGVHFYTLNKAYSTAEVLGNVL